MEGNESPDEIGKLQDTWPGLCPDLYSRDLGGRANLTVKTRRPQSPSLQLTR